MKETVNTQSFMDSFRKIFGAVQSASRSAERNLGLSAAQLFVLQRLQESEPLSLKELAERTYSHPKNVAIVVEKLWKKGFITKKNSARDRRQVAFASTMKGKNWLKKRRPLIQEKLTDGFRKMKSKDQKDFDRLLKAFIKKAGLINQVPHLFLEQD